MYEVDFHEFCYFSDFHGFCYFLDPSIYVVKLYEICSWEGVICSRVESCLLASLVDNNYEFLLKIQSFLSLLMFMFFPW